MRTAMLSTLRLQDLPTCLRHGCISISPPAKRIDPPIPRSSEARLELVGEVLAEIADTDDRGAAND